MDNYYNKYLKYKNKYLTLKKLYGGTNLEETIKQGPTQLQGEVKKRHNEIENPEDELEHELLNNLKSKIKELEANITNFRQKINTKLESVSSEDAAKVRDILDIIDEYDFEYLRNLFSNNFSKKKMRFTYELDEINYYDSKVFILEQIIKLYKNCLIILNLNDSESIFEDSDKIEARLDTFQETILDLHSSTSGINFVIDVLKKKATKDNINLADFYMHNTVNEALQRIDKKDNEGRILNQKILESKNSEDKLKNLDILKNLLQSVKKEWQDINYEMYKKYRIEELRRR